MTLIVAVFRFKLDGSGAAIAGGSQTSNKKELRFCGQAGIEHSDTMSQKTKKGAEDHIGLGSLESARS